MTAEDTLTVIRLALDELEKHAVESVPSEVPNNPVDTTLNRLRVQLGVAGELRIIKKIRKLLPVVEEPSPLSVKGTPVRVDGWEGVVTVPESPFDHGSVAVSHPEGGQVWLTPAQVTIKQGDGWTYYRHVDGKKALYRERAGVGEQYLTFGGAWAPTQGGSIQEVVRTGHLVECEAPK